MRELSNMIERGVLVGAGPLLDVADLGMQSQPSQALQQKEPAAASFLLLPDDGIDLEALEEEYIRQAFHKAGGNEMKAAKLLGMTYYAFRYKYKKLKDPA